MKFLAILLLLTACNTAPHKPKFKPGDCLSAYGSKAGMVFEIMDKAKCYGILIGGGYCDSIDALNNPYTSRCSGTAYDIDVVDKNFELRKCDSVDVEQ